LASLLYSLSPETNPPQMKNKLQYCGPWLNSDLGRSLPPIYHIIVCYFNVKSRTYQYQNYQLPIKVYFCISFHIYRNFSGSDFKGPYLEKQPWCGVPLQALL
jgi:hypothetical protein